MRASVSISLRSRLRLVNNMRPGLKVGTEAELVWRVAAEHVIHLGYPPPSLSGGLITENGKSPATSTVVFSTPNMILLMERTARKLLEPFLEPGEESVGAKVAVEHLGGTPLGAEVRGVARVTSIDKRAIEFEIEAYDRFEQIGRGTHRRAVVPLDRIAKRITEKADADNRDPAPPSWMQGIASNEAAKSQDNRNSLEHAVTSDPPPRPRTETIELNVDGPVATVTLNRPKKKNAVNVQMTSDWEELNRYFWHHPEIRVVLVTGAGDAFCAGDDVPEVGTLPIDEARQLSYRQARLYLAWEQLPQVFIAAINGDALGAGCVAACACDLRIASHAARLGMPEVLLGWPPGYGVAQLTALIGKARAMEMCLAGQPVTARQSLEWGLVNRLTATSSLLAEARKWAAQLLQLPTSALRETKKLVHADEGLQPKTAFLADTAAYIHCLQQADAREGISAFKEKRPPRFH